MKEPAGTAVLTPSLPDRVRPGTSDASICSPSDSASDSASDSPSGRLPGGPARTRGDVMALSALPPTPAPVPDAPYTGWIEAARSAGHPALSVTPGRYRPDPLPLWSTAMPPNDLLEAAQEYARAATAWVHVRMPSLSSVLVLGPAIRGPRPTGPAVRPGGPTALPWSRLVADQHVGPRAITETRDGVTVHVLDVPVAWLAFPISKVGPPVGPTDPFAPQNAA